MKRATVFIAAWENEYKTFYKTDYEGKTKADELDNLIREIAPEKNEFLVRLGRFSQVECVTVNEYRRPWNRKGWGKNRTVFNMEGKLVPLGWTKVVAEDLDRLGGE